MCGAGAADEKENIPEKFILRTLADIPAKPNVGVNSIDEVCNELWELKTEWAAVRKPMEEALLALQTAANWEGTRIEYIIEGLLTLVAHDVMKRDATGKMKLLAHEDWAHCI